MMNRLHALWISATVAVLGVLVYHDLLFSALYITLHLMVVVVGIFLGTSWSLVRGKQYKPTSMPKGAAIANSLLQQMMEKKSDRSVEPKKVVISRNTDLALQEVIDLTMRDFILSWYKDLSRDQETLLNAIRGDIWVIIKNLTTRLSRVDTVKFISKDVIDHLHKHFTDIRHSTRRPDNIESVPKFVLHPWLESEATEREFLSKICEVLLLILLPDSYKDCKILRHLLREIITSSVFKPMVDMVCDPDYINCKLIGYIDYRRQVSEDTRRTYTYAATYEDFVKMIDKCEDIEHLRQIRYNILTEIIQATTIKNLQQEEKAAKGSPKGTGKGDFLKARNLKRYINQLTVAKSRCEKRIHAMGGPDYKYYTDDADSDQQGFPAEKVMSFSEVMDSITARQEFLKFLKRDDNDSLLSFWNAVEKLKNADKRHHHQIGSDIYHLYVASSTSVVKVDRITLKSMETFLRGDTGPDAFYEAQEQAYQILQKDHYPSFLVSDVYLRYIRNDEDDHDKLGSGSLPLKDQFFFGPAESFLDPEDVDDSDSDLFASQSYAAQQRMDNLDEKIRNKNQAIQALQTSKKTDDAKIGRVEKEMEEEQENLVAERKQLEAHILRMQTWSDNLGKWRAHVYETEVLSDDLEKKTPVYVLIIHLAGSGSSQNLQKSSHGWVVSHTLSEFTKLHYKLIQIGPWLRKKELPTIGRFTTVDDKFIQESKKTINEYLSAVMKDDRMAQSEVLCRFLTPTPDYLKQQETSEKKRPFFFTNLLRSLPIGQEKDESEDDLLFTGDESSKLDRSKDSIAEPFYNLVNEVFELRGMFKWLRKSFIMFVEVTFGRSINRQLRETFDWIFSEPMVIYYIRMFKDSMWPDGQLAPQPASKSDEDKLRTRIEAKEKFLQNMPDAVRTLLGENNARRGSIKIFEVLQDVRLNKHLFYGILELLLLEICPELTQMSNSPNKETNS